MPRITYDQEAGLAYIYILSPSENYSICATEELEINEGLALDLDQEGRVVGGECFGKCADALSSFAGTEKLHEQSTKCVKSFRLTDEPVRETFHRNGIEFCFGDDEYKRFLGYDLVDAEKYIKGF